MIPLARQHHLPVSRHKVEIPLPVLPRLEDHEFHAPPTTPAPRPRASQLSAPIRNPPQTPPAATNPIHPIASVLGSPSAARKTPLSSGAVLPAIHPPPHTPPALKCVHSAQPCFLPWTIFPARASILWEGCNDRTRRLASAGWPSRGGWSAPRHASAAHQLDAWR